VAALRRCYRCSSTTEVDAVPPLPGGLTSVYGKRACSFYDAPEKGIAGKGPTTGKGPITIENQEMFETFLVRDTGRKDHAGKRIIDIYGGIKWGWQVQAAQS
jgi:hypothetical protein